MAEQDVGTAMPVFLGMGGATLAIGMLSYSFALIYSNIITVL